MAAASILARFAWIRNGYVSCPFADSISAVSSLLWAKSSKRAAASSNAARRDSAFYLNR